MDERVHWRLCDLASAEIEALAGEGIVCTPEEVLRIQWLAQQVESPAARMEMSRGSPVHVGGAVLWPMTLLADAWWRSALDYISDETDQIIVMAFAMAHSRTPDTLESIPPSKAVGRAREWLSRLSCRISELVTAISIIREQDEDGPEIADPKSKESTSASVGDLIASLVATVGGTPDLWEGQVAIGYIRQQMEAVNSQMMAKAGIDQVAIRRIQATRTLGLAVEEIRQSRKAAGNG